MKFTFALVLLFQLIYTTTSGQLNLIQNPEMENGKLGWTLAKYSGASGMNSIDTTYRLSGKHSMAIQINHRRQENQEDLQLFQIMPILSNKTYSIYFKAMVNSNSRIALSFGNDEENYWTQNVTLNKKQQEYGPYYFTNDITDFSAYFSFLLGNADEQILIDSVCVVELDKIPDVENKNANLFISENLINSALRLDSYTLNSRKAELFNKYHSQISKNFSRYLKGYLSESNESYLHNFDQLTKVENIYGTDFSKTSHIILPIH